MMQAIALRRFSHDGTEYAKGAALMLPDDQFAAWRAAGIVRAAPAKAPRNKR